MDVTRLNFSWGTHEEHASSIQAIREVAAALRRRVPIVQDLSGPRIQEKEGHHPDASLEGQLTEKDRMDLSFGIEQKVDYVALSYVGSDTDIFQLRAEMKKHGALIPIIAKIERRTALENLDRIVTAADALMVARGDLGNEIPIEQIPFIQRRIIRKAKAAQKPVITATQMLLSMVDHPFPTRAEVTDVAYAILDGSDAVMLSEETARGMFPVEAVSIMERIILEAERHEGRTEIHPL